MDIQLDETEARILGCLLEKERTTPDAYPLTLNALQMACNQKSSRKPVMSLTTSQIETALDGMRYGKHLVYQVSQAGSRVPKYKHNIEKIGAFSEADSAILGVLMLRGPQTASEVKTHCERLHHFDGRDEVEVILEELRLSESGPFVHLLPREHGRRERRYTDLLSGAAPVGEQHSTADAEPPTDSAHIAPETPLAQRVAALEAELAQLRSAMQEIQTALGLSQPTPESELPEKPLLSTTTTTQEA
ncbi:MAG: hypothetical protein ACI9OU_000346 [Candidatus Promineifilaceae bacterium]|jgi:uncharacterized protein YceH (UPF0502 family)